MRKAASITILALAASLILVPVFILEGHAMGCTPPGCQFQVITHVPAAEHTVNVKLDGGPTFAMNHTFTFTNSTTHTIQIMDTFFIGTQTGNRYTFKQWTYVGTGQQWDSSPTMTTPPIYANYTTATCSGTLNCPFLAEYTVTPPVGCRTNCRLQALTTVPSADGTVMVRVDGGASTPLSQVFSFGNGTVHTIQMVSPNSFVGSASGATYVWKQWSCACGIAPTSGTTLTTPTMYFNYTNTSAPPENGVGAFTAEFDKLYQLTVSFSDPIGNAIAPANNVTLTSGNSVLTLTTYSATWVPSLAWTVSDVTWESVAGSQVQGQSIDLTGGSMTKIIQVKAYSATVKTVNQGGSPVSGAVVTVTLLNSTMKTFTTDSQGVVDVGYVPKGLYTAHVTYQGADAGSWSTDASATPTLTVTITSAGGGSPLGSTTVVSAVVLLTIFGVAAFLLILAIRVRKPPAPPQI